MKSPSRFRAALAAAFALSAVSSSEATPSLRIAEGPILLHSNLDQQWGGHTFAYLLEGERCLFWSATVYNPDGKTWGSVVGQYPKPGSDARPATTIIRRAEEHVKSMTQPLLLRSDDGYIHVFFGVSHDTGDASYSPGEIRYFRSAVPEDVTQLVERAELIPRDPPYNEFHLRMNAGVSRDGRRAALAILAISRDGSVPFNTPVILYGEKQDHDFVFRRPVKYAEPMSFFYPQIAVLDSGIVLVGQLWDNHDRSITRLVQLDTTGKVTHSEDLPATADGNFWCCDLRPEGPDNWSRLVLQYNKYPKDRQDCRQEFWTYEPASASLTLRRSVPVPESAINYGKWIPVSDRRSVFLHNPSMSAFEAFDGDLLGEGEITTIPLAGTHPAVYGAEGTASTFVPNPLQGSVSTPGSAWFATDAILPRNDPNERIRSAMLLFRLAFE